ncbi:MAG: bifunctional oligoribonuclease/PAP phosphatase NrnA [Bacilli bacterium]|nr:bifunctional oligoribonuclease/PAP phosphatase NrnA [Bacilli bacterium]
MNSEIELDKLINLINNNNKFAIFTHESPDGDAIGSSLALYMGLKELKKEVDIITDEYPDCFNFLKERDKIISKGKKDYDVCIALDCATEKRLYDPTKAFYKSIHTISIDHHASNTFYAECNYVEDKSPATCKTLVRIFKKLNIAITKEIGEAIMMGIITDSGGFRYDTVDDETFEIAAEMLDVGVNISNIYRNTFDKQTKSQFELSKIATSRLKFINEDRIAITYITLEDIKKTNAKTGDHEGIVNIGRKVEGVLVSIFLRETEKNIYKISLRSNSDDINVSEIAEAFDGGGHSKAAGCIINGSLEKAINDLIKETNKKI